MIPPSVPTLSTSGGGDICLSLPTTPTTMMMSAGGGGGGGGSRGAFIVLEGIDRCGKTTQCNKLVTKLLSLGIPATGMRFPDRTTATGSIINTYLQSSNASSQLNDQAIHLLFSANRWENANLLKQYLVSGTTVICDRYAYSGVAFSSAKIGVDTTTTEKRNESVNEKQQQQTTETDEATPVLSIEWCIAPDRGLPAPDCVVFLELSQEDAEQRGGFGTERYEKRDLQLRVRKQFTLLQEMDTQAAATRDTTNTNTNTNNAVPWTIIDASQSMDTVEESIWNIVEPIIQRTRSTTNNLLPIKSLWEL